MKVALEVVEQAIEATTVQKPIRQVKILKCYNCREVLQCDKSKRTAKAVAKQTRILGGQKAVLTPLLVTPGGIE